MTTLYEKDFYEWSSSQASHLRNKEIEELDYENLIEEIESLGGSNKSSLSSYLARGASLETQIKIEDFPKECPWSIEDLLLK